MKFQVVGETGMLGSAVIREIMRRGHTFMPSALDLDVVVPSQIKADVVINCAGIVKQNRAATYRMIEVNAVGPHRLADACWGSGARLIHMSTDCVFNGLGPHNEVDLPVPGKDTYSRSKLAGEVGGSHITVRSSFVGFGKYGLLQEMMIKDQIVASNRLLWSGHTVDSVAKALIDIGFANKDIPGGILHIPGDFQSRWQLVVKLKDRFHLRTEIIRDDSMRGDRRLISRSWDKLGLPYPLSFDVQLEEMWRHG